MITNLFKALRSFLLFIIVGQFAFAQNDKDDTWVAKINTYQISKAELAYAFNKNRDRETVVSLDSLKAYLEIYINFKLKVYEAYDRGIDTSSSLKAELKGYLEQLKKPYKEGFDVEGLSKEAYERMKWEINASHILLKVDPKASPKDTLIAFSKIDSLRNSIRNKEEFEAAARKFSQDGSAPSGGQLGWFSVFSMVYPFETAAYETKKGEVSQIVKTQFGYHLVFVNDKRQERGRVRTSHIFFSNRIRTNAASETLANRVYDSLKNGGSWNDLVKKFSDDGQTKQKGGSLPMAGLNQLPDEFLNTAFDLDIGEFAKPIKTNYGWHIIKLDKKESLPEFEKLRPQIQQQVERSGRNQLKELEVINKLKKQYNFIASADLNETLKSLQSSGEKAQNHELFKIGTKTIDTNKLIKFKSSTRGSFMSVYPAFEKQQIIAYADSMAPYDYPEYGFLRQEYKEGLLLFEIMQSEVWNKAIEDSLAQVDFYNRNIQMYTSPERISYYEIKGKSINSVESELKTILVGERLTFVESKSELKIAKKNIALTELTSFEGFSKIEGSVFRKDEETLILTSELIPAGYFNFAEIRGKIISDLQEDLDQEFIKKLRKQRKIKTNKRALKELLSELD